MTGFPKDAAVFLEGLSKNNERGWFHANKKRYEMAIKNPAKIFSAEMADALADLTGHTYKRKVFRINRDLRFSKDKTPYNTHVRMSWTPEIGALAPPTWMMSLEREELIFGVGNFDLKGEALGHWRDRVNSDKGRALAKILSKLEASGARLGEPVLKRVPAPYEQDHPRSDLLKRKGLNVWIDETGTRTVEGGGAVKNCLNQLKHLRPVFDWLAG